MVALVSPNRPSIAVVRAILDLETSHRPRGYDTVEGCEEICRIWVGRAWWVLYSIQAERSELVIERRYARRTRGHIAGSTEPGWGLEATGHS